MRRHGTHLDRSQMTPLSPIQLRTLVRFGVAISIGNLGWEMAHVPLLRFGRPALGVKSPML